MWSPDIWPLDIFQRPTCGKAAAPPQEKGGQKQSANEKTPRRLLPHDASIIIMMADASAKWLRSDLEAWQAAFRLMSSDRLPASPVAAEMWIRRHACLL